MYTFDENNFDLVKAFRGKYINELSPYTWGFSSEKGDINVSYFMQNLMQIKISNH